MKCRKCGTNIVGYGCGVPFGFNTWGYCEFCSDEFVRAKEDGAIILDKETPTGFRGWYVVYYDEKKEYLWNSSQVQAIVKARKIAKKKDIKTIIFCYSEHGSVWFLDNYLNCHPRIKKVVLEAEKGIFG